MLVLDGVVCRLVNHSFLRSFIIVQDSMILGSLSSWTSAFGAKLFSYLTLILWYYYHSIRVSINGSGGKI